MTGVIRDRAWVEARYTGNFRPPPADAYDECVQVEGAARPYFLRVRPREDGSWDWSLGVWDGYDYCPHWDGGVDGISATEAMAWAEVRKAAGGRRRVEARWEAEWAAGHPMSREAAGAALQAMIEQA